MCMKTKKKNSIYVSVGVCATIAAAETFLGNGMWLDRAHRTDGRARSWCDTRSIASLPRTIPKRITFLWDWNKGTRSIFSSLFFFLFVSRALQTHGSILMTEVRRQKNVKEFVIVCALTCVQPTQLRIVPPWRRCLTTKQKHSTFVGKQFFHNSFVVGVVQRLDDWRRHTRLFITFFLFVLKAAGVAGDIM